ncbi:hypothetical protein Tco_0825692 [Tanacetum coccineum]
MSLMGEYEILFRTSDLTNPHGVFLSLSKYQLRDSEKTLVGKKDNDSKMIEKTPQEVKRIFQILKDGTIHRNSGHRRVLVDTNSFFSVRSCRVAFCTRKSHFWRKEGIQFLGDKLSVAMSKKQDLYCNVSQWLGIVALSDKLCLK